MHPCKNLVQRNQSTVVNQQNIYFNSVSLLELRVILPQLISLLSFCPLNTYTPEEPDHTLERPQTTDSLSSKTKQTNKTRPINSWYLMPSPTWSSYQGETQVIKSEIKSRIDQSRHTLFVLDTEWRGRMELTEPARSWPKRSTLSKHSLNAAYWASTVLTRTQHLRQHSPDQNAASEPAWSWPERSIWASTVLTRTQHLSQHSPDQNAASEPAQSWPERSILSQHSPDQNAAYWASTVLTRTQHIEPAQSWPKHSILCLYRKARLTGWLLAGFIQSWVRR